ncbi:MAG: PAS domain S-box protein [Anaerolineae bacterium]|nr:PAS domain S-box protein [Anaerolineae bacterium]
MSHILYVLTIEDSESDAALVARLLRKSGLDIHDTRVDSAVTMQAALDAQAWDVIISDYSLPQFDAPAALALVQQAGLDIPFIVISGTVGEETAVAMMKAGAHDYLMKDNLLRLVPAVERELREAQVRHEQRQAAKELQKLSSAVAHSPASVIITDRNGQIEYVNPKFTEVTGYMPAEVLGQNPRILKSGEMPAEGYTQLWDTITHGGTWQGEFHNKKKDGTLHWELASISPILNARGEITHFVAVKEDITDRKRAERVQAALYRISEAAHEAQDLGQLFAALHSIIAELMPAQNFFIALHDADADLLSFPYYVNAFDPAPDSLHPEKSLTGYVLRTGEPLLANPDSLASLRRSYPIVSLGTEPIDWLGVPLKIGKNAIGVIVVQTYTEEVRLTPADQELLVFVSAQAAMAIQRKRDAEALREREAQYHTLFETMAQGVVYQDAAGYITAANPAAERILGLSLDQMQGRTSFDPRWRALHLDGTDFPGETHPATIALQTGKAIRNVVMGIFNPLTEAHSWINVNAIPQFRPGEASPHQVYTTLEDITERIEAEAQIRRLLEQQIAVNQLALALGETLDLACVYQTIYKHLRSLMNTWTFVISSFDAKTQYIQAEYAVYKDEILDVINFPPIPLGEPGQGTQSQVIHSGKPLYTPNHQQAIKTSKFKYVIGENSQITPETPEEADKPDTTRSALYVPMNIEGQVVGVIQVQSTQPDAYTQADIDLLSAMANVAAIAVQNARLYEAVQKELVERQQAELALHASEQLARATIDALTANLCVLDEYGAIIAVNRAWREFAMANNAILERISEGVNYLEVCDRASGPEATEAFAFAAGIRAVLRREREEFAMEYTCHSPTEQRWFFGRVTRFYVGAQVRIVVAHHNMTEVKLADMALRESEARYRLLAENMSDTVWLMDMDWHILYVSPSMVQLRGYTFEEFQARPFDQQMLPDSAMRVKNKLAEMLAPENLNRSDPVLNFTVELECPRKHQSPFWSESTFTLILDQDGQPYNILGSGRDVTERKHAEAALRKNEAMYRAVVENQTDLICRFLPDGTLTFVNAAYCRYHDAARDTLLGSNFVDRVAAEDRDLARAHLASFSPHKPVAVVEYRVVAAGGKIRWLNWIDRPIFDHEGNIVEFQSVGRDVTERKLAEEKLRASELLLRTIADNYPNAYLSIIEQDFTIGFASGQEFKKRGLDPEQFVGLTLAQVFGEQAAAARAYYEQAFAGEEISFELFAHQQYLLYHAVPLFSEDGAVRRILVVIENITERKREENVQAARLRLIAEAGDYSSTDLLQKFLDEAEMLTESEIGFYHFVEEDQQMISLQAWSTNMLDGVCTMAPVQRRYPISEAGVWADCVRTRQPVLHNDYASLPHKKEVPEDHTPVIRELVAPVIREGKIVAILGVGNKKTDYESHDVKAVQQLADMAWETIIRRQAEEVLQRRVTQLALLNEISGEIAVLDLDKMLARAVSVVQQRFGYRHVGLFILDDAQGTLVMRAKAGEFADRFPQDHCLELGQGMVGWVGRYGETILANDVDQEPRYVNLYPDRVPTQAELAMPIRRKGDIVGVLDIQSTQRNAFDVEDVRVIETLARQVAVALENARLYEAAQQEIAERKQAEIALAEERAQLEQRVIARTADLSRANVELERAARLKDEFLASMSHELRTPLNAVLGLSESLQEEVYGPLNEKQLRSLQRIEESGRHLLALINDILDVSKIEAGKVTLDITTVAVESVCQASLRMIRQNAHKKQLHVSSTFDSAVTLLHADARRLKQILVNLLNNAVKFTPEGGEIGLDVVGDVAQEQVHFTVWDTGIGIAQTDIERLFQPFMQLDSSLSRKYAGTGLGLSLVRRLTELHGGGVTLESQVGVGSRFTVSLPWQPVTLAPQIPEASSSTTYGQPEKAALPSPVNILLAEDNENNIITISKYLQAQGYHMIVARNGLEAVQMTQAQSPDLILMDIQMPKMDGLEAIRRIRAGLFDEENVEDQASLVNVPIIALTALAMPGDRERCLAAGANIYLSKPVSLRNLAQMIAAQLSSVREAEDKT